MRRITQNNIEYIREKISQGLVEVERELGVSISVGLATLTPHNAIFKLETAIIGDDGIAKSRKLIVRNDAAESDAGGIAEIESFMIVDRDTGEVFAKGYSSFDEAAAAWPEAINVRPSVRRPN